MQEPTTRVTINMVAARAGVSRGTVDRVLNQRPHVRPDIYQRVVAAINELGYRPPRQQQAIALGLAVPEERKLMLGVLLPNWTGAFKTEVERGIADARDMFGGDTVQLLVERSTTNLPDEILEHIDVLVDRGAQGIALCSMDHPSIVKRVNELCDAGIPVVTFNSDLTGSRRLCFVGEDILAAGRVAGELMSKLTEPSAEIIVAIGSAQYHGHHQRMDGFLECIGEHGQDKDKLYIIETYNDYHVTAAKVSALLREHPGIAGIYMANESIPGCVDAVRQTSHEKRIHIVGHDLTEESARLLRSGDVSFVIGQNIYRQGLQPLITLRDYLQKGVQPDGPKSRSDIEILCAENIGIRMQTESVAQ